MKFYSKILVLAVLAFLVGCEASELNKLSGDSSGSADVSSADGSADTTMAADASVDVTTTNLPAPATVVDEDLDGDHYTGQLDCDETNPNINHYAEEKCDGVDNNCDGKTDEGVTLPAYPDADKDSFGTTSAGAIQVCKDSKIPHGFVLKGGDCNDSATVKNGEVVGYFINPNQAEECDGVDNNCDGVTDDLSCPVRTIEVPIVPAPVATPPAADVSLTTSSEINLVVMYANDATRTVSSLEFNSLSDIGKPWTILNKVFTGKSVTVAISSKDICGERFSIATGDNSWSCMGNGAGATLDKAMTVYLVLGTKLWIDVTDKVEIYSDPNGQGCSPKLIISPAICK